VTGAVPSGSGGAGTPAIVVYTQRDRTRTLVRAAFPRRRARVLLTRTVQDFDLAFKENLVDAALVDVGGAQEDTWRVASRAREYPSVPFFGLAALRAAEGPALAQCAAYEFADMLVDGVDDGAARDIISQLSFSARFGRACRRARWRSTLRSSKRRGGSSCLTRAGLCARPRWLSFWT
jgi:hypothetical protein